MNRDRPAPTGLVLDFDGVIADGTNRAYIDAYLEAIRATGLRLPQTLLEARILQHWGASPRMELAGALVEAPDQVDAALDHYQRHIVQHLRAAARPIEGVLEAVATLAQRYRLYVISGMGQVALDGVVRDFGLEGAFQRVVSTSGSDEPWRQKRSGYHLRQLLAEAALRPHQVLCVGDAESDIAMARSCGVEPVAVLSGNLSREAAQRLGVAWILPSLVALPGFLDRVRFSRLPADTRTGQ
ncbi:MAG: HAD family hydrolase [Candidatus Thiodiazotropha sp.]